MTMSWLCPPRLSNWWHYDEGVHFCGPCGPCALSHSCRIVRTHVNISGSVFIIPAHCNSNLFWICHRSFRLWTWQGNRTHEQPYLCGWPHSCHVNGVQTLPSWVWFVGNVRGLGYCGEAGKLYFFTRCLSYSIWCMTRSCFFIQFFSTVAARTSTSFSWSGERPSMSRPAILWGSQ